MVSSSRSPPMHLLATASASALKLSARVVTQALVSAAVPLRPVFTARSFGLDAFAFFVASSSAIAMLERLMLTFITISTSR